MKQPKKKTKKTEDFEKKLLDTCEKIIEDYELKLSKEPPEQKTPNIHLLPRSRQTHKPNKFRRRKSLLGPNILGQERRVHPHKRRHAPPDRDPKQDVQRKNQQDPTVNHPRLNPTENIYQPKEPPRLKRDKGHKLTHRRYRPLSGARL